MIELQQLGKRFGVSGDWAVRALDLRVERGELLVILGESGCGKTTTLKMINRLVTPTRGRVLIDDKDAAGQPPVALRRRIGYVFQGIGLFPHLSVARNVAVVPELLGWAKADTTTRVDELLELVRLPAATYRDRLPGELSGGQRQRVGLARALAARPKIMLMDEPFGALDPLTRDQLQDEYRQIHRDLGLTTVMVTHDMFEALLLADRIAVMRAGELLQLSSPHELLSQPADAYVASLMRSPKHNADRLEAIAAGEGMG
jgi:osmoprotectant transport system ATP-binding protein